ncbi:MAG: hypothetical protein R2730_12375 [Chitinophagales bacterium]
MIDTKSNKNSGLDSKSLLIIKMLGIIFFFYSIQPVIAQKVVERTAKHSAQLLNGKLHRIQFDGH